MRISLDGRELEIPAAATLGELIEGIAPEIDPTRIVMRLEVDGTAADPTDVPALAVWRLLGEEQITIESVTPAELAATRRREIGDYVTRIADLLELAASGLVAGETMDANRLLATGTRELGLVLELDHQVAVLGNTPTTCDAVCEAVRRIGTQLTEAERDRRWPEVATLLTSELVPALRASAVA
jgi:hypothetical protein